MPRPGRPGTPAPPAGIATLPAAPPRALLNHAFAADLFCPSLRA